MNTRIFHHERPFIHIKSNFFYYFYVWPTRPTSTLGWSPPVRYSTSGHRLLRTSKMLIVFHIIIHFLVRLVSGSPRRIIRIICPVITRRDCRAFGSYRNELDFQMTESPMAVYNIIVLRHDRESTKSVIIHVWHTRTHWHWIHFIRRTCVVRRKKIPETNRHIEYMEFKCIIEAMDFSLLADRNSSFRSWDENIV